MRLFKGFIITVAGFFIIITLLSLLMPSNVITSRTINIAAKPEDIMDQVRDLNNWKNWHPIFSEQKIVVTGTNTGQVAEWMSNDRRNQLKFISVSSRECRVNLTRPGENIQVNKITVLQYKDSNNVQVEWSALTRLKWYPWEKFSGIFVDKITGPGYDVALTSLKNYLENPKRGN